MNQNKINDDVGKAHMRQENNSQFIHFQKSTL